MLPTHSSVARGRPRCERVTIWIVNVAGRWARTIAVFAMVSLCCVRTAGAAPPAADPGCAASCGDLSGAAAGLCNAWYSMGCAGEGGANERACQRVAGNFSRASGGLSLPLCAPAPTLVCFRWNGSREELFQVDPQTGETQVLGTVGDLAWWSGQTAIDPRRNRIYVFGSSETQAYLYVLEARTGVLIDQLPVPDEDAGLGVRVNGEGDLLYGRWNGTEEELVRMDPETGATAVLGIMGDLSSWSAQTAYDVATQTLHVAGSNGESYQLYHFDGLTGAPAGEAPLDFPPPFGLQARDDGMLFYARWNGSQEELVRLDPVTGASTAIGIIGDLAWWSGVTVLPAGATEMFVFGSTANDELTVWTLDTETGALLHAAPLAVDSALGCLAYY